MSKQKQAAIAAVARHFSAACEKADGESPAAYLTLAGKRIAVDVTAIEPGIAERAKPRLRFDKVAQRLIGTLQTALSESVPDGTAVIFTVTAPIRQWSKTAGELEDKIRERLARRSVKFEDTICGNRIRVRVVKGVAARASKAIGFVHNPDTDTDILFDLTQSMLRHIGAAANKRPPGKFTGERWLVVVADGFPHIEICRQVYAKLSMPAVFKEILMVFAGNRVETLTG